MSQYLGRGAQSRGRVTINETLQMVVSEQPFLHNAADREAVIMGIDNMRSSLSGMPNLTWFSPAPNQTTAEYVDSVSQERRHGATKLGLLGVEADGFADECDRERENQPALDR